MQLFQNQICFYMKILITVKYFKIKLNLSKNKNFDVYVGFNNMLSFRPISNIINSYG